MKIAVVILAGGEGSRIGGDKPHKLLGGKTLLERAVTLARQWSEKVAVAVREETQLGGTEVRWIRDAPGVDGPLGGLATALRFADGADCDSVLTIPADMPFLPPDLGQRLMGAIGHACVAIATSGGHLHPVCAVWRTSALDVVPDYIASGGRSLRGFAEAAGFEAVEWASDPADPFFNINSAEVLEMAERLLAS